MDPPPNDKTTLTITCFSCGKRIGPAPGSSTSADVCACDKKAEGSVSEQVTATERSVDPGLCFGEHYEVLEKVGQGSLTTVYKVRRKDLDGYFAVKVLRKEFLDNPRTVKRFKVEAQKACNLNHANLAVIYEIGKTKDGLPYLVTDFLEGESLAEFLKKEGFLDTQEALNIFIQVCEGLSEAHKWGLIHRDLKPSNILLKHISGQADLVKIADFGIAKVLPNPGRETLYVTPDGEEFGNARYMSPEQCTGNRLDARSDIYSLGCVLYECLGGKPPFSGANPVFIMTKQISLEPESLTKRFVDLEIPSAFDAIVLHALEKDPDSRYQSIDDLRADLILAKDGKNVAYYPKGPNKQWSLQRSKPSEPNPRAMRPAEPKPPKNEPLAEWGSSKDPAKAELKLGQAALEAEWGSKRNFPVAAPNPPQSMPGVVPASMPARPLGMPVSLYQNQRLLSKALEGDFSGSPLQKVDLAKDKVTFKSVGKMCLAPFSYLVGLFTRLRLSRKTPDEEP